MLALTLIVFLIPVMFTKPFEKTKQISMQVPEEILEPEEVREKIETIKLLHAKTGEVEELSLEEYIYGVVASEMPVSYEKEALKAQAVVARTYTVYKTQKDRAKHENADICDDYTCCQAWMTKEDRMSKWEEVKREENWEKIVACVNETKGEIVTYQGNAINAFFHANSGGSTETPVNVWGGSEYPYLQTVETAGEDAYQEYQSEVTMSFDEFRGLIKAVHTDFVIDFEKDDCIEILERTEGNRVKTIKIGNLNLTGTEIRNIFKLKSANFEVHLNKGQVEFQVIGYGHGVGLSQTGADSLAKQGKNYQDIIFHFYTDVEIKEL